MNHCHRNKYYYSLNDYLKDTFGQKIYKLSLNAGLTCPNRDGICGTKGCIFCSRGGSGDFAQSDKLSINEQIENAKKQVEKKIKNGKYIAYFQAYTNTYAKVEYLEKIFTEAILHPDIVAISIATRPDCLPLDVLNLLEKLNKMKPVWVELGLQTIHKKSAEFIRRGYDLNCFDQAVLNLNQIGVQVIVHLILGLPNETREQILKSVDYVCNLKINGIKLQMLHVLKDTDLADVYNKEKFKIFTLQEYIDLLAECIKHIPPHIIIHRITGDGPKSILIEPKWSANKKLVLNTINQEFAFRNVKQGTKSIL